MSGSVKNEKPPKKTVYANVMDCPHGPPHQSGKRGPDWPETNWGGNIQVQWALKASHQQLKDGYVILNSY